MNTPIISTEVQSFLDSDLFEKLEDVSMILDTEPLPFNNDENVTEEIVKPADSIIENEEPTEFVTFDEFLNSEEMMTKLKESMTIKVVVDFKMDPLNEHNSLKQLCTISTSMKKDLFDVMSEDNVDRIVSQMPNFAVDMEKLARSEIKKKLALRYMRLSPSLGKKKKAISKN